MEEEVNDPGYSTMDGVKAKIAYHFEGLIPLIIILIFVAIAGHWLGFWHIPFLPNPPIRVLIIGRPSPETLDALNSARDLLIYRIRAATSLRIHPENTLANYDLIILDQTYDNIDQYPLMPRTLGKALDEYVKKGGKLIIVQNSGIMRPDAPEAIGWLANIGDTAPVECTETEYHELSCLNPISVRGRIISNFQNHPIVKGIEVAPPYGMEPLTMTVFDVTPNGKEIAYIEDEDTHKTYVGIVEKMHGLGKVIYFNYNPGLTRAIFLNAIEYLK